MVASRAAAVDANLDARFATHGNRVALNVPEPRRCTALALWQGEPQLEHPRLPPWNHALAVDDSAACGHPLNVPRLENSFIAVVKRSLQHERHRLEPGVRVRPAGGL